MITLFQQLPDRLHRQKKAEFAVRKALETIPLIKATRVIVQRIDDHGCGRNLARADLKRPA